MKSETVIFLIAMAVCVGTGESYPNSITNSSSKDIIVPRQAYGFIKFGTQQNTEQNQYGLVTFDESTSSEDRTHNRHQNSFNFPTDTHTPNVDNPLENNGNPNLENAVIFQDDNHLKVETERPKDQKQKRLQFNRQQNPFNFPSVAPNVDYPLENNGIPYLENAAVFQNDNNLQVQTERPKDQKQKKRRKRRRKPKRFLNEGYEYRPSQAPSPSGVHSYPYSGYSPEYHGQLYQSHRRKKQSLATQAFTAVTDALTSIALYDDYQCVPRLLCEAASGGALAATTSPLVQSIANLQPLLTLLAAYNGASTSPLFVFGRAVFLGMTSKNNPGTCRYAYSLCPNDPEQLVHYLNNHNGGFFRFFSAPQHQLGPQNVEQFYNQLAGPGQYGLQPSGAPGQYGLQPSGAPGQYGLQPSGAPGQYGLQPSGAPGQYGLQPSGAPGQYGLQPSGAPGQYGLQLSGAPGQYGLQPSGAPGQYGFPPNSPAAQNYGLYPNHQFNGSPQFFTPGLPAQQNNGLSPNSIYNGYPQNFGSVYPQFKHGFNQRDKHNNTKADKIQKRIQNLRPQEEFIENMNYEERDTKWSFPDSPGSLKNTDQDTRKYRGERHLKFPEKYTYSYNEKQNRQTKSVIFPGAQTNRQYDYFSFLSPNDDGHGNREYNVETHGNRVYNVETHGNRVYNVETHGNRVYNVETHGNREYNVETHGNRVYNVETHGNTEYNVETHGNRVYNVKTNTMNLNNDVSGVKDGYELVYIVRGDGDPANPEVVRVKTSDIID